MSSYLGNSEAYIEQLENDVERLEEYIDVLETDLAKKEENEKLLRTETGETVSQS